MEVTQLGQEDYIWAMRTSALREDHSSLFTKDKTMAGSISTFRKDRSESNLTDEYQTKVMASLVPDEVIYNVNDYTHRDYDACFLFGDVSGFTELCEKYNKTGVSGPSRMTQVLNKYLGAMVQEILSHNGDVLKFSGDAFLAIFKSSENETMRDAVHEAMDCALVIQKSYGSYQTDVGVIIRVKLAISAGHVMFALIGDEKNSHYVVVGKPIWDVKAGEHISSAGDIIVSPAAWHYINTNEYLYQDMDDGIHIKLLGVGPNWRSAQKNVRQQKLVKSPSDDYSQEDDSNESGQSSNTNLPSEVINDEFSLRPAVNVATRLNIKKDMRKFIIAPVMKSIDMEEPFEYLTEMRQSVIVFINVVSAKLEIEETVILADQTYKVVCRVVDGMNGCVNKVSLFDKDLMFVVIFGLRGLKHELECQIALRCATECHDAINKLTGVLTTSIGVTTGKTYCGVFGHTLRREYTVISLIVNKAARLMVAYKNKVTCDRETFLHSKLEARNFILQEPKPLKGISHPGPIYEFKEVEVSHAVKHKINAYPLLGREDKMKIYIRLLDKFLTSSRKSEHQYKMLLIQGEARQGKTRLLDELIFITPSEIPVNRFSLTIKDIKIPYETMRLFFLTPLGLSIESSSKEREEKILHIMRKTPTPDLLCALNVIFGVNFKVSDVYLTFDKEERAMSLRRMVRQLCFMCFNAPWVVAIDDAEFIDEESWDLMDLFFDFNMVFIVATMGTDVLVTSTASSWITKDARVKVVPLNSVDRWYQGALACQVLDVFAIPAELEKIIQARSNGNPGWIESFLISMIQDEGLYILNADLRQINELGLVCPPLYMMSRMNREETLEWKHIMEERRPSMDSMKEGDYWKRYIDSCRDSYLNVTVREKIELRSKGGQVPVCVMSPNFNVTDVETELSMDVMILKTFDSLTSYEQLLVKCSAILGNQFPREMLLYVMAACNPRQAALAVQKLFEIRVITCARGDFLDGGNVRIKERLRNPGEDLGLACECRGIKYEDNCADLPRYASCGYMQFRSSMFRDITYNLLTDNQKKEFHYRAIRYLEKETRRCRACGNGYFDRILGAKHEDQLLDDKDKKKTADSASASFDDLSLSRKTSLHSGGASTPKKKIQERASLVSTTPSGIFMDEYNSFTKNRKLKGLLGITIINRLKNSFSLTRAFSNEDFTDCQCSLILNTTYAQLINHSKGAGDENKMIDAMIEYAYICVISSNMPLALRILEKAVKTVTEKAKIKTENAWKYSLIKAKLYTIIGFARIELGQFDEAIMNLNLSLAEYGLTFPTGSVKRKLQNCTLQFKQLFGLYVFPKSLLKNLDHWESIYANNLSECLSHFCTIYTMQKMWQHAELAATWSLSAALESFSDFKVICIAYANMIFVAQKMEKDSLCVALEVHALRLCHQKRTRVEAEEMKAVGKLYAVIFVSRVYRSNMEKSIHIGYIVLRICASLHSVKVILPLLPLLVQCLLMGKHTSNAIAILQDLDYFADEDSDNSGKVWYYSLCICFHLETGYCVVPFEICEHFFQLEGENWITIRDPSARMRYFTVMWLWCIRNERWEAASLWCPKTKEFLESNEWDSPTDKITALYLLEGLLLCLVYKKDKRNVYAVMQKEKEINNLFATLERSAKETQFILGRLYHLKAYYRYIKYNDQQVPNLLNKAKKYCEKFGNTFELSWIDFNFKAWNRNLPTMVANFWRDHCEPESLLDYHELEINAGKIGYFTLPTPLYV